MKFFIHLDSNMSNPDLIEITTLKYSGKILLKVRIEDLCQKSHQNRDYNRSLTPLGALMFSSPRPPSS